MRKGLLILCLLLAAFGALSAEEETELPCDSLDLFAEPSSYVDGVNVISGRYTYSTTDMVIQGPRTFEVHRQYLQGHNGSLGVCWETNTKSRISLTHAGQKAQIIHGPCTGLSYIDGLLDPELYKKGLTNTRGRISGKSHPKNVNLSLVKKGTAINLQGGDGLIQTYKKAKHRTFKLIREEQLNCNISSSEANTLTISEGNSQRKVRHVFENRNGAKLLTLVNRPQGPNERYHYHKLLNGSLALSKIERPDGRYIEIDYYNKSGKVRSISDR